MCKVSIYLTYQVNIVEYKICLKNVVVWKDKIAESGNTMQVQVQYLSKCAQLDFI